MKVQQLLLPKEIFKQHTAVLGKTRSGKSSLMRYLVEWLLSQGMPVCIVDPKGDWWGIKLAADGTHAGYALVIFGGEHADVPINEHSGKVVAELFATGNRPCLIDLSGMMVGERTRFWIDFAATLFKLTKGERYLVVDEIHNFAPKGKIMDPSAGKALHWTNRLASEGLGRGIAMLFASQRPQKVHNDTLTSAETLIAMRVLHPADRGAISDWIKGCGDDVLGAEVLKSLAQLARGEGWAWSPEIGFGPKRMKFPKYETYDSFAPQSVHAASKLKGWASVDLTEVREKMGALVQEAEANDPAKLRARIAELTKQLDMRPMPRDEELQAARTEGKALAAKELEREIQEPMAAMDKAIIGVLKASQEMREGINMLEMRVGNWHDIRTRVPNADPMVDKGVKKIMDNKPPRPGSKDYAMYAHSLASYKKGMGEISRVERAFLTVLAQHGIPMTRNQVAIHAKYSSKSRHVDNTLSSLRVKGYIEGTKDELIITQAGLVELGNFEALPTGVALRQHWISKLNAAGRKFFNVICLVYPDTLTRDEAAEGAGYSVTSRHADNTLSELRTKGLITGPSNAIKASDNLF